METKPDIISTLLAAVMTSSASLPADETDFSSGALDCNLQDGVVITLSLGVSHFYPDKLPEKLLQNGRL